MKYRVVTFLTSENDIWYKVQKKYCLFLWHDVKMSCFPRMVDCISFISELKFYQENKPKKFKSKVVWP